MLWVAAAAAATTTKGTTLASACAWVCGGPAAGHTTTVAEAKCRADASKRALESEKKAEVTRGNSMLTLIQNIKKSEQASNAHMEPAGKILTANMTAANKEKLLKGREMLRMVFQTRAC